MSDNLETKTQANGNPYAIPAAIIIAGLLISGTLLFTRGGGPSPTGNGTASVGGGHLSGSRAVENTKDVTRDDHIIGSLDAPVKIIEYSDLECPFCKRFHPTVQRVVDDYDGEVAWVWRHFPLTSIHPKAVPAAVATECAAEQAGNQAFWDYIDRYYEVTPSNNNIDLNRLPAIAQDIGLDRRIFENCLTSNHHEEKVRGEFEDAIEAGGNGTPYTVVISPSGAKFPIIGAQPYEQVKAVVERALQDI